MTDRVLKQAHILAKRMLPSLSLLALLHLSTLLKEDLPQYLFLLLVALIQFDHMVRRLVKGMRRVVVAIGVFILNPALLLQLLGGGYVQSGVGAGDHEEDLAVQGADHGDLLGRGFGGFVCGAGG
jgi:hypothetical protein